MTNTIIASLGLLGTCVMWLLLWVLYNAYRPRYYIVYARNEPKTRAKIRATAWSARADVYQGEALVQTRTLQKTKDLLDLLRDYNLTFWVEAEKDDR
jgi:hypothetical protein